MRGPLAFLGARARRRLDHGEGRGQITGRAEVKGVREDKPLTKLDTRVTRHDGTVVLEGDAVCYTAQLA